MSAARRLLVLCAALLLFRIGSAAIVFQPGYTDAYYYADVAKRLAAGQGLTADFVWNFLEASGTPLCTAGCDAVGPIVVPSHQFWMPLATVLQAVGIKLLPFLDPFRAAQTIEIVVACLVPLAAYAAARSLGASSAGALVAATLAGLGGAFAPGWVSLDAFAPAAVLGTAFFLVLRRAARGDVRSGALAGALVGLLYLARAEGALFGLPLLALALAPGARRAGAAGAGVALLVGLAWLARDLSLHADTDLLSRTVLLGRYESFFAIDPRVVAGTPAEVLASRPGALAANAVTFAFAFGLLLVPGLAAAAWVRRERPEIRAFAALLVLVYLVESLLFALHSTRGSYFHSLAAFFPFGVALGVVGTAALLRTAERARVAAVAGVLAAAAISVFALAQWDVAFNRPYAARVAALPAIPAGPFLAIDAAAWRWIADRPVYVTPSDLSARAACVVGGSGASSVVLEPAHFSAYEGIYAGERSDLVTGPPAVVDGTKVYRLDRRAWTARCEAR